MNPNDPERKSARMGDSADRNELIAAYVCGDLDGAERAAFVRRMAAEPDLRAQVEQCERALTDAKDWLEAPPPGLDKVAAIPIPTLPISILATGASHAPSRPRTPWRARGLRWLAAAALFLMGVLTGRLLLPQPEMRGPAGFAPTAQNGPTEPAAESRPVAKPPVERLAPVAPRMAASGKPSLAQADDRTDRTDKTDGTNDAVEYLIADAAENGLLSSTPSLSPAPARTYRESDGRVIVESSLAATGGQAVWVVDGTFQLAQTDSSFSGGSQ